MKSQPYTNFINKTLLFINAAFTLIGIASLLGKTVYGHEIKTDDLFFLFNAVAWFILALEDAKLRTRAEIEEQTVKRG